MLSNGLGRLVQQSGLVSTTVSDGLVGCPRDSSKRPPSSLPSSACKLSEAASPPQALGLQVRYALPARSRVKECKASCTTELQHHRSTLKRFVHHQREVELDHEYKLIAIYQHDLSEWYIEIMDLVLNTSLDCIGFCCSPKDMVQFHLTSE